MCDEEEWLNVERWLEPWGDEEWRVAGDHDDASVTSISDSERLLDMDFRLQLIDQRLRQIGDAKGALGDDGGQEESEGLKGDKYHGILGPVRGEQQCDPDAGCSSTLKYHDCPKCPTYPIQSAEAVKLGAGSGPQLVEGFVNCRSWSPGRVKTFPLKKRSRRWFELQPEVLRTRMGARVTLVVKPGARGIDIVRGELLGSCQKLNQVRVDPLNR